MATVALLYWYGVTRLPPNQAALVVAFLTGPTFAAYGAVFSLMPALIADVYGARHSAANFGCLYTSKAVA